MQHLWFTLAAAASYASAQSTDVGTPASSSASASQSLIGAVVPIGQPCDPNGTPCALGANCYATNSMLIPVCGNFQASCTSDQQCAFNKCNQGFCNGDLLSSSSSSAPQATTTSSVCPAPGSTDSQGRYSCNPAHQYPSGQQCLLVDGCYFLSSTLPSSTSSAPTSAPSVPAGTLPLGAECNALQQPSPCADGVQCWASNAGLITRCGNFNAVCSSNAQCAYNTCNNGLCNGLRPSGSHNTTSSVPSSTGGHSTSTSTSSYSPPIYTGAASPLGSIEASGVMAALLAAIAWAM